MSESPFRSPGEYQPLYSGVKMFGTGYLASGLVLEGA